MNALEDILTEKNESNHQNKISHLENEQKKDKFSKQRKSILDRFGEKLKEFLDNA